MNPDQFVLWQRIQAHVLDDPKSAAPFSLRLAAENGWGPAHAQRAIEEYRRFTFLAAMAGHPVSPSDAVDQVWHLHLLYTRDYWNEFCAKTLGMPLHHGPARGGAAEADKFADWYARTLASYRRFFGEPPADLWPEPAVHPKTVRVDVARNWIVPKPRVFGVLGRVFHAAKRATSRMGERTTNSVATAVTRATAIAWFALLLLPGRIDAAAAATMQGATTHPWPFDLRGPEFLQFFFVFAGVVFGLAMLARWYLRKPADRVPLPELDGYQIAHLSGGSQRAFVAALAGALQRGLIILEKGVVKRSEVPVPAGLPLLETAVCAAPRRDGTKVREVRRQVEPVLESLRAGLAEHGLAMSGPVASNARLTPFLIATIVPLIGFVKVGIGLDRNRPVSILIVLSLMAIAAALFFLRKPRLSRRGAAALRQLRERNQRLSQLRPTMLASNDAPLLVPMAVGLWGLSALDGTPLAHAKHELRPVDAGGVSGSACGSSDSGSGDGGGSGCGGCGGGGGD